MASMSTPAPQVSVTDAAREAIEHTRRNLFPIRIEKWLILGLLTFLDQCGRSLNGSGPGGGGGGDGPNWPDESGRGAVATVLNLPQGAGTTTIESKTNFFAPAPTGATITGECTPLHRGKRTMVWQTRVTVGDKLVALITQTQMVLEPRS